MVDSKFSDQEIENWWGLAGEICRLRHVVVKILENLTKFYFNHMMYLNTGGNNVTPMSQVADLEASVVENVSDLIQFQIAYLKIFKPNSSSLRLYTFQRLDKEPGPFLATHYSERQRIQERFDSLIQIREYLDQVYEQLADAIEEDDEALFYTDMLLNSMSQNVKAMKKEIDTMRDHSSSSSCPPPPPSKKISQRHKREQLNVESDNLDLSLLDNVPIPDDWDLEDLHKQTAFEDLQEDAFDIDNLSIPEANHLTKQHQQPQQQQQESDQYNLAASETLPLAVGDYHQPEENQAERVILASDVRVHEGLAGPSVPVADSNQGDQTSSNNETSSANTIDPTFLEALPEDLRAEVLASQLAQPVQATTYTPPSAEDIDPEFLAGLPPDIQDYHQPTPFDGVQEDYCQMFDLVASEPLPLAFGDYLQPDYHQPTPIEDIQEDNGQVYDFAAQISNISNSFIEKLVDLHSLYLELIQSQKVLAKEDYEAVNEKEFALLKIERDLLYALARYINTFQEGEKIKLCMYREEKDAYLVRCWRYPEMLKRRLKKLDKVREAAAELDDRLLGIVVEESTNAPEFDSVELLEFMVQTIKLLKVDIMHNCFDASSVWSTTPASSDSKRAYLDRKLEEDRFMLGDEIESWLKMVPRRDIFQV
ncbi:uncharacterized protein LOC113309274 [Papaver somniferum]|uniref:uncharacterized protein LOC113309274 n=1 Tax=Papaver somniferum TaxID=3469 RepID=UPI000E705332|nr:uncharacterized protein LOC113309274 [Papaver somniferum]